MKTLYTPPSLIKVILHHVSTYYKVSATTDSESPQHIFSDELHLSIKKQSEIGWGQFIRGRISKDFQKTMHKHYRLNNQGRSYTGKTWMRKVIKSLLDTHIDEWIKYCEAIHTSTSGMKNSAPAHATMITLIKKYYQQSKQLPKNKKKWFSRKIEQFSDWHVTELQKWLRTAKRIIHTNHMKSKRTKQRGSHVRSLNKDLPYKHKVIPAPSTK